MKTLLTIAGYDPSSGAGITADLTVFAAHGFMGTSAITALTVQSTVGVAAVHPVKRSILVHTLDFLVADLPPAGIKIGMLASAENVVAVSEFVERLRSEVAQLPVVLDPAVRSSSGRDLLSGDGLALLRQRLLPLVTCATPNLSELGQLTDRTVETREQMESATAQLMAKYPQLCVIATGGHLQQPDDLVAEKDGHAWLRGEKIASRATHGTGCAFSSALLCGLVQELTPFEAARQAKRYVAEAIRRATPIGAGQGPMNLLWPFTAGNQPKFSAE